MSKENKLCVVALERVFPKFNFVCSLTLFFNCGIRPCGILSSGTTRVITSSCRWTSRLESCATMSGETLEPECSPTHSNAEDSRRLSLARDLMSSFRLLIQLTLSSWFSLIACSTSNLLPLAISMAYLIIKV